MKIENAIISVSNKEVIVPFAKGLEECQINLFSTGNTFKKIQENGVEVSHIETLTGMSEMLDGRVRTLHPKVHGGLLYRRDNSDHLKTLKEKKIKSIDLVVVNLYPFKKVTESEEVTNEEAVENIDIGGVALIRAAAKNYRWVTVVCEDEDLQLVLNEIRREGQTTLETRSYLAVKAFRHTMNYDVEIASFLSRRLLQEETKVHHFKKIASLRYGENPHQSASIYRRLGETSYLSLVNAKVLHGREMSYNNYLDAETAVDTCWDFTEPAAVVVKHQNPCGISTGETIDQSLTYAWEGDVVSAFGSIIAVNRSLNLAAAKFLKDKFIEIIIAPDYEVDALDFLTSKSKNLRIIQIEAKKNDREIEKIKKLDKSTRVEEFRYLKGGLLSQEKDNEIYDQLTLVSPKGGEISHSAHYRFSVTCVKHIKSNAVAITHEYAPNRFMLLGMGAGQPNRVDAVRKLALTKAKENVDRLYRDVSKVWSQLVLASDAFFPFKDNIDFAYHGGICKIIQPGGSTRDEEVIDQARKYGIEMVFSHKRHFLH